MEIYKSTQIKSFPPDSGVYSIGFINSKSNKVYIGSASGIEGENTSSKGFYSRWKKHLFLLRKKKHHSPALQNAYEKYGEENLIFTILKKCSPTKCLQYEQKFINKFDSFSNGYNGRPNASNNKNTKWSKLRLFNYENKFRILREKKLQSILDLYNQNKSTREIATILNISRTHIRRIFKDNNIKAKTIGYTRRRPIIQFDLNGNKLNEWESILKCTKTLSINRNSIRQVLNGTCKQAKGFTFKYG